MSAFSEVLGDAVAAHEFKDPHTGKVYRIRPINIDVKVALERRLYGRAREILRDAKADLTKEEYTEQLHLLGQDYQLGEFAFEGKRGQQYILTVPGMIHLGALLFQCDEMEFVKVFGENQVEVLSLLQTVLAESLPRAQPKPEGEEEPEKNADQSAMVVGASRLW